MSDRNKQFEEAFREFTAAQINLSLVQAKYSHYDALAVAQAKGTAEGTVSFLIRMLGRNEAAAFFYKIADGVAAPTPQTVEK